MGIKKIELGESDGFLFGGVPRNIVVNIFFYDGRCVKFPYSAKKSIAALYDDINKVAFEDIPESPIFAPGALIHVDAPLPLTIQELSKRIDASDPTKIEKGDIVKCIHLENRNDHGGTPGDVFLVVGNNYRVTKVLSGGYEVLDDAAPMKFKLFLMKHEVELFSKHGPVDKKKTVIEEGINCPKCSQLTYCDFQDGFYRGQCECGQEILKTREEVKSGQASVGSVKATE